MNDQCQLSTEFLTSREPSKNIHNKLIIELFKGVFGLHDGWKRLHQDEHWKGGGECHPSCWTCYVQGYQVILPFDNVEGIVFFCITHIKEISRGQGVSRSNRLQSWVQACWRHKDCQGCHCMAGSYQGLFGLCDSLSLCLFVVLER